MNTTLSSARVQASAILRAWGSNDRALLERNLASAEAPAAVFDAGEGERLEMLAAIAGEMRRLLVSNQLSKADPHLPLLRHLASAPPGYYGFAYRC
jgi:hypothetical protein